MTYNDDAVDSIAKLAQDAAEVANFELVNGRRKALVLNAGQHVHEIDLEQYLDAPPRKKGHVSLGDADSFNAYVARHSTEHGSTLWANLDAGTITAVLNDHEADVVAAQGGQAGHGDHRAVLSLPSTPDWLHWLGKDGELLPQTAFAEHIEDGATSIRVPDAASMLELAQTFMATTDVQFKSSNRLDSGETQFRYEENVQASAGISGSIAIPQEIVLGLQPFENGPTYEIRARFRYRMVQGGLKLGYRLIRPDLVRRQAFADITADVSTATGLQVLVGTPRR